MEAEGLWAFTISFLARQPMGCLERWHCLSEFWCICLSTFRSDGPTHVLSFSPLSEICNVNGFYLMFFPFVSFSNLEPICQCHPCLWLSEFSFTLQTLLFSSLLMMLMVVMDYLNGNSFTRPCSSSYGIEVVVPVILSVCTGFWMTFEWRIWGSSERCSEADTAFQSLASSLW